MLSVRWEGHAGAGGGEEVGGRDEWMGWEGLVIRLPLPRSLSGAAPRSDA